MRWPALPTWSLIPLLAASLGCSRSQTEDKPTDASPISHEGDADTREHAAWLESEAAAKLALVLGDLELEATSEASRVRVGEHEIVVAVEIEHAMVHDGSFVLAAAFSLRVDGALVPAFTTGAIGIGRDVEDARETAVGEWLGQAGAPIAFAFAKSNFPALAKDPGDKPMGKFYIPLKVEGRSVFTSPVGLRGGAEVAPTLTTDTFMLELAAAVAPFVSTSPGYHTVAVQLAIEGTTREDAGCRVDGVDSPELFRALESRTWPADAGPYIFKQFFVFY